MLILGVDPGIARTGWALLKQGDGPESVSLVEGGLLKTRPSQPLTERLLFLHCSLVKILEKHRPQTLALEELFFMKAASSVAATSQARGVILLAAALGGCPVAEYNPREVKSCLTGNGNADKPQMQKMVKNILRLPDILMADDTADAMAIALCHLKSVRFKSRIIE